MKIFKIIFLTCLISIGIIACKSDDDGDNNNNQAFFGPWEFVSVEADDGNTYGVDEWFPYIDIIQGCEVIGINEKIVKFDLDFLDNENLIIDDNYVDRFRGFVITDSVNCIIDYSNWNPNDSINTTLPYKYSVQGSTITLSFSNFSETGVYTFQNENLILDLDRGEFTFRRKY